MRSAPLPRCRSRPPPTEVPTDDLEPPVPDQKQRRILVDTPSGDTLDLIPRRRVDDPPSGSEANEDRKKPAKQQRLAQPASKARRLRFGSMTVSGRLSPAVVRDVLDQRRVAFQTCAVGNGTAPGTLTARFVIGRDGAVSNVANGGVDGLDSALVNCVLRALYGLTFPEPEGGIVTVAARLTFAPP